MASAVIIDDVLIVPKLIATADYPITEITSEKYVVVIDESLLVSESIGTIDYPITSIDDVNHGVRVDEILPFRVRFTNIGIEGYGSTNIPPIGIAIVGINNYIL